jgi:hypothetical protein
VVPQEKGGVQPEPGDQGDGMSLGLAEMQKLQHRVAAVSHQYQIALGQPTAQLNNHLAG